MPLSALYLGERIESCNMTTGEWAELKRNYRTSGLVMACGQAGVPKTSTLGTQFFAHKSNTDCRLHEGGPESTEHLATKAAVARAAREIGWDAVIEFPAADRAWIADVLVTNGERIIAIEAQWSAQSQADFERRQARYEAVGIECFWLTAAVNKYNASTVPHHALSGSVGNLRVWLPSLTDLNLDLGEGIKAILQGEIVPVAEFVATCAAIKTQMSKCWKCDRWMSLWTVTELDLESRCGGDTTLKWSMPWVPWALQRHEQALEATIRQAIQISDLPAPIALRSRRSTIADRTYLAMNCPSCGAVQGDGRLAWRRDADEYAVPLGAGARLPFNDAVRARPHLCRDFGRGRCSQESSTAAGYPAIFLYPPASEYVSAERFGIDLPELPPRGSRRRTRWN